MIPTDSQRAKAADVCAELITAEANVLSTFRTALIRELKEDRLTSFGCYRKPDKYITAALKRAKLDVSIFTSVLMIDFDEGDKIKYMLDGIWYER
jgi:hypothetical protein